MINFLKTAIPIFLLLCSSCNNGVSDIKATNTVNKDSTTKEPSKRIVLTEFIKKLQNADKVILISHEFMSKLIPPKPNDESSKENNSAPKSNAIVINGRPNTAIIIETSILDSAAISNLINILSKSPGDSAQGSARCFEPHHAILMESGGTITSYLDICFSCFRMRSSADIPFSEEDFDIPKWDALYEFVKQQGFKYELQR